MRWNYSSSFPTIIILYRHMESDNRLSNIWLRAVNSPRQIMIYFWIMQGLNLIQFKSIEPLRNVKDDTLRLSIVWMLMWKIVLPMTSPPEPDLQSREYLINPFNWTRGIRLKHCWVNTPGVLVLVSLWRLMDVTFHNTNIDIFANCSQVTISNVHIPDWEWTDIPCVTAVRIFVQIRIEQIDFLCKRKSRTSDVH